jgi:hypothetical protein
MCNLPFLQSSKVTAPPEEQSRMSSLTSSPRSSAPEIAQFSGENFVNGGGVAIFHVATGRVVICKQTIWRDQKIYFLPKGRRDAGEESGRGAEREGYEEVCY